MTKSCQCMHEVWESGTFSAQLEELYGAKVSAGMISEVTDSVLVVNQLFIDGLRLHTIYFR